MARSPRAGTVESSSMSLVGAALAGGASRRMGRDKATMKVDGERLVDSTVRRLACICSRVVVADRGRELSEGISLQDGPGRGPAAGILGVAMAYPKSDLLILACDLPAIPEGLLEALTLLPGDLVLPRTERGLEPLCALYRPRALAELNHRVSNQLYSLHPLANEEKLAVTFLDGPALRHWGDPELLFRNLNSPADLDLPAQGKLTSR